MPAAVWVTADYLPACLPAWVCVSAMPAAGTPGLPLPLPAPGSGSPRFLSGTACCWVTCVSGGCYLGLGPELPFCFCILPGMHGNTTSFLPLLPLRGACRLYHWVCILGLPFCVHSTTIYDGVPPYLFRLILPATTGSLECLGAVRLQCHLGLEPFWGRFSGPACLPAILHLQACHYLRFYHSTCH